MKQSADSEPASDAEENLVPRINHRFARGFTRYCAWRIQRAFHRVRITRSSFDPSLVPGHTPLLVYSNHSSWWDPLLAMVLRREQFPDRLAWAPIDAEMLEKYSVFKPLGIFGVDRSHPLKGTRRFLRQATQILEGENRMLWMTPQGRFADVRERPVKLEPGLAALVRRIPEIQCIPVAVEYTFWEESAPEILIHIGPPCKVDRESGREAVSLALASALERCQDYLAEAALARNGETFRCLLQGRAGTGSMWDLWTRTRGLFSGSPTDTRHSRL